MKNKILIVLLCCITALGYAQEVDELLQATSAIEMLDGTTRASASNATSQATLRCVQVIKPEVSAILQQVCRMQDLIEIIIEDLGDVSISDELIISQLAAICSKIENININVSIGDVALTAVCDLDPVLIAISESDSLLCSKLELIESQLDNLSISACDVNLDPVLTAIDNSEQVLCSKLELIESQIDNTEQVLCSKLEIIDSKLDNLNISLSCDLDPVITAIDESEQILCSKLEIIDSKIDVLNLSRLEVIIGPITFTIGDLTITAICDFTSVLDAISESDALLCSKLEIIDSKLDNISTPCAPTPIFVSTTITAEGVYCLANMITGPIRISHSDVVLDMSERRVDGGIVMDGGIERITIMNGVVQNSGGAAIAAGPTVTNVTIENVLACDSTTGIFLDSTSGGAIINSKMANNSTGLLLNNSYKIEVINSIASGNEFIGFSLMSSSSNSFKDCSAINTGIGNTQTANNEVFGFVSQDGHSNIFERCIANATQALSTTDSQSVVAGFALRGDESCTKIIDSEAANSTTSASGVTVPYGILLEAQLDGLVSVTNQPDAINSPRSVAWSPDQKYLAAAINGDDKIEVYEFDQHTQLLTKVAEQLNAGDQPQHVSWSPDSRYIACSFIGNGDKIAVYEFNRSSQSLTFIDQQEVLGNAVEVEWSYDGRYLAVAISTPIQKISIYEFNSVSESIRFVTNQQEVISNPQAISWSPDDKYTAAAVFSDNTINIYQFDITSETLILAYSQSFLPDFNAITVAWSPDGKYIAAGGNSAVRIYEFDRSLGTSGELLLIAQQTDNTFDVSWSPDGKYVAVVVFSDTIKVYEFDRSSGSLVLKSLQSGLTNPQEAVWSPDGQYIALALGTGNEITIYSILSFPSKNVITNNTVYCNSGGNCPSGVGISGSSIQNLIIGNTAYSNPVPQSANHPIVGSNYYFVTNVFSQLFGQAPSDLQNISVDGCAPICTPTDVGLLAQQIKYKVCVPIPSQLDVIESKIDLLGSPCTPTAITAPTTITAEGVYCVANTIAGEIEINGSDIVIDLNGYDIQGGIDILTGSDNVTILNGTVSGSSDAIRAEGATNITLENITARNATVGGGEEGVGIHFINVVGGLIKNCEMTQNITGLEFNNTYKIVVDHSVATGNTYAGFSLVSSSTNCLRDCKAVDTGSNNTQVLNNGVFGFISKDGHSNIFERCIANATQALSTTDSQSVVAGFALRGNEKCTKIIDSESANATTSPDGVTVPYGILLEAQFDALVTVTQDTITGPGEVVWSPDGKYVAVAQSANNIVIYEFDRESQVLIKLSATPTGAASNPRSIAWSADGNYLAVALLTGDMINVYEFDSFTGSLTKIANQPEVIDDPSSVAWSPNGQFLAAALRISDRVTIYEFDKVAGTLTKVSDQPDSIDRPVSVSWSPDGNYVAAAIANSGRFTVYGFDRFTKTLISLPLASQSASTPQAVYWSPDGKYLAAPQILLMRVYEFDRETESLNLFAEESTTLSPVAAAWSPDGQYLAAAILSSNKIGMYFFDRSSRDLILLDEETVTIPFNLAWSPDGQYTAVAALNANLVKVYDTLTFPSKNVITNNTVYCNSGGNCPSGVGISGSSIQNLIIGNTAYSNPVPQSANHPIVGSNYYFVTNVFNQLFGQAPSDLQNISVDGCAPICTPTDLALLAQQIKYKVCVPIPSQLDVIESKIDLLGSPCTPTVITAPTTITAEGVYCVANTIAGEIEINGSDIVIDLNGYDIQGGIDILAGSDNVTILNGTVSGSSDAIRAEGATNITLENVTARNATVGGDEEGVGIHFINVVGGLIKNCEMTQNITGLEFNNTYKIVVDHSVATGNTYAGFSLVSSSTNCLRDCKAVDTGSNNTQVLNNGVFGFVSKDGHSNIFERCIANATQALSTTDYQSVVAGFALRGNEKCTKIIDSEAANSTTSPDGVTVPYGILLEAQFDALITVTNQPDVLDNPNEVRWSPDGKYVAVAASALSDRVTVYSFDRKSQLLTFVTNQPTSLNSPTTIAWSPDGKYLAAAYGLLVSDDLKIEIYAFDSNQGALTFVADSFFSSIVSPQELSWSPNGRYLACVAAGAQDVFAVYEFNRIEESLTFIAQQPNTLFSPRSVVWSPDGKYIAVADLVVASDAVLIYAFDNEINSLVLIDTAVGTNANSVSWSPDAKYIAAAFSTDEVLGGAVSVYAFDRDQEMLLLKGTHPISGTNSVDWSSDGRYIVGASRPTGVDTLVTVYEFDRSINTINQIAQNSEAGTGIISVDWSPDGGYIAGALQAADRIDIYRALTFPSKNVITNNTVYCNSGGNCPSGVGISGSSIQNLIIGNTAYSNPVPQSANHPIVGSNYYFVTNVFNQLFGQAPSDLQNISVDGCAPICSPTDLGLLAQQIKYKVCVPIPSQLDVIESKIDVLPFGATQIDIAISTQIDINASLQEVIDVIQSGDAVLCSKLEIIDSQLDVVESKIDVLPFGATQIDIAISTQIDINASLQEVIDVIQSGDEILCSKLEVIQQKIDNITSSAMASPCAPTAITAPTTITAEGVYCVANTIAGEIEINGSDIVVDLNGYDIQGGIDILAGSDNVTILNGTVSGASDAIRVEGATNITLENVKARNATAGGGEDGVGIHFINVLGGLIKNCEMTQNLTGLEFNNSHNITVDHSIATANSYAGFSLISSFTNCFRDCKSISTGAGNNQTSGNIFGFVSRNGGCNIFENSIANGTQGLGLTDCNALVAGFALRGSESCSKIINSESANTTTNPNGLTIPYGILLEDVFDVPNPNYPDPDFITGEFLITLTAVPVIPTPSADVQAVQWRPDQKYFAAGYDSAVSVYSFNNVTYVASKVADGAAAPTGTVTHLDWSPDGKYLAVGTTSGVFVYEFCTLNCTLKLVNSVSLSNVSSVDWHPTAKYLAVATNDPDSPEVYVYTFDRVAQSLTQLFTPALSTTNPVNDVQWSPNGNYLAVVDSDNSASNDLFIYGFNKNSSQLSLVSTVGFGSINVHAVAWRFDGKYIAAGGDQSLRVLEINSGVIDPNSWGYLQGDTIYSLDWSENGKYIVIGTDASATAMPDYLQVIQFDPCQSRGTPCDGLVLIAVPNIPPAGTAYEAVNSIDWSPDGQFILAGTDDNNLRIAIYDALSFPMKNVINNNTVYCNSGGSCPSGIGISGSSVANMIIGNTAYSNPVHPPVIGSNYVFVTNVFDQLFGQAPTDLQNISVDGCQAICQPEDPILLLKQIKAIVTDLSLGDINISSCDFTQVINAINEAEQNLCSKIENISVNVSSCDVNLDPVLEAISQSDELLCSKIEAIPFGVTAIDVNFTTQIDINLNTMFEAQVSGLDGIYSAIDEAEQTLCSKLEIIESKLDVLNISISENSCDPTSITASTTISTEGIYCVANTIAGEIEINGSDIVLNVNGYDIQGGIDIIAGSDNVTILNGTVSGSSDAIRALNATNITLENVKARNATVGGGEDGVGIHFINVVGGLIKNCEMIQNVIGLELDNSHNITIEDSIATSNRNAGFSLVSSSTNCFKDCKALKSGEGNTQITDAEIFGFVSTDGYSNIFERCIANATQALSTTDYNSVIAGFALRGNEKCSKIIESESANATTNANGMTIPFGILLEAELDNLQAATTIFLSNRDGATVVAWSPDGRYLAVNDQFESETPTNRNSLNIYSYEYPTQSLTLLDRVDGQFTSPWAPDGSYSMGSFTNEVTRGVVYRFDKASEQLIPKQLQLVSSTVPEQVSSWSPDRRYVTFDQTSNLYFFNALKEEIEIQSSIIFSTDTILSNTIPIRDLGQTQWSPDGDYVLNVFRSGAGEGAVRAFGIFELYEQQLMQVELKGLDFNFPGGGNWSPDGKYFDLLKTTTLTDVPPIDIRNELEIYEFDRDTKQSSLIASIVNGDFVDLPSGDLTFIGQAQWSPDSKYIAVGFKSSDPINIYYFDHGTYQLTKVASFSLSSSELQSVKLGWSPDGSKLAITYQDNGQHFLSIFNVLKFPEKNIITGNTVYCNSGNACPGGVGISGSSIANAIVGNIAYSNPIPQISGVGPSNKPIVESNYHFATNVFNPLFGQAPSDVQNISLNGCENTVTPIDVGLIVSQIRYTADNIVDDLATHNELICNKLIDISSEIDIIKNEIGVCQPIAITEPTTITSSGIYCLANSLMLTFSSLKIQQQVVLAETDFDVELDLNGYAIVSPESSDFPAIDVVGIPEAPPIQKQRERILIKNGAVRGTLSGMAVSETGIQVSDVQNITLQDINVDTFNTGISLTRVPEGLIQNCTSRNNKFFDGLFELGIGFLLTNCSGILIEECSAIANQSFGFSLVSSHTVCLVDCKALNTGKGVDSNNFTRTSNFSFAGFVSENGSGNIFERCIASGTQLLANDTSEASAPSTNQFVANFALIGNEQCSKIIACEACNLETLAEFNKFPFGILLGSQSSQLITVTGLADVTRETYAVKWSPNGKYLAQGQGNSSAPQNPLITLYEFDGINPDQLVPIDSVVPPIPASVSPAQGQSVAQMDWSPDGAYLAIVMGRVPFILGSEEGLVLIYAFDSFSQKLTLIQSITIAAVSAGGAVERIDITWSPDGNYLALVPAGDSGTTQGVLLFRFNRAQERAIEVFNLDPGFVVRGIDWSPDGRYLAVMGGSQVTVYEFNQSTEQLELVQPTIGSYSGGSGGSGATFSDLYDIKWSPDGRYVAVVGLSVPGGTPRIFLLLLAWNPATKKLTQEAADSVEDTPGVFPNPTSLLGYSLDWHEANAQSTSIALAPLSTTDLTAAARTVMVTLVTSNGRPVTTLTTNTNASLGIYAIDWSPDGAYLATGSADDPTLVLFENNSSSTSVSNISRPKGNVIKDNVVYCNSGFYGGVGISGSSIENLIINNTAYSNPVDPLVIGNNYANVTNVFNPLFGTVPLVIQNISLDDDQPICVPENTNLLVKQTKAKVCDVQSQLDVIESKVDFNTFLLGSLVDNLL